MADAIYLRKSRRDLEAEAHGDGETLSRHRTALLQNARRLGRSITEIYAEIVTGDSIAARPEMQRLMRDVEAGRYEAVHVMEVERLARGDSLDQGLVARAFKYSGTKIITPLKIYDPNDEYDEEYFEFGLFMSRRELKTITRRQQRGRVASALEGKWPANKAPYGYRRVKLVGQKGWTLEPEPDEAEVLRSIFRWYTDGFADALGNKKRLGVSLIARRLNEGGIPPRSGRDWTSATVRDMLRNPAYAGWVRWGHRPAVKRIERGEVVISTARADPSEVTLAKGLHPPLVAQEVFDAAQKLLARNRSRPGPRQLAMKNPLSGLVICSRCGRAMVRRPYKDGRPDGLICPYASCAAVSSALAVVEAALLDAMRLWYAKEAAGEMETSPFSDELRLARARLDSLEKDRRMTEGQLKKAYELVERGVYTSEVFLDRSRTLSAQLDENARMISQAEEELKRLQLTAESRETQLPRIKFVLDAYPHAPTPEDKNALLRSALEKVMYTKTRRERWTGGSDLQLHLFPRLPCPPPDSAIEADGARYPHI